MNLKGNTLDDVTSRLIDAILADNIFSKEKLFPKIRAILGAWIKIQDSPVGKYPRKLKPIERYIKTIEQRYEEAYYWRKALEEHIGAENMKPHYDSLKNILREKGYLNQNP